MLNIIVVNIMTFCDKKNYIFLLRLVMVNVTIDYHNVISGCTISIIFWMCTVVTPMYVLISLNFRYVMGWSTLRALVWKVEICFRCFFANRSF